MWKIDSSKRPTAEECQNSEWLREWTKTGKEESKPLNSNVIQAIRAFRDFSDIQKLLCEVIGFALLPEQISLLRKEFEKLDIEGKGEITKSVKLFNATSKIHYEDFVKMMEDSEKKGIRMSNHERGNN